MSDNKKVNKLLGEYRKSTVSLRNSLKVPHKAVT